MPIKNVHDAGPPIEDPIEVRARELLAQMRMRSNQQGCRELSLAITSLEQAILWLKVANGSAE